jgi:hypothetical protein
VLRPLLPRLGILFGSLLVSLVLAELVLVGLCLNDIGNFPLYVPCQLVEPQPWLGGVSMLVEDARRLLGACAAVSGAACTV